MELRVWLMLACSFSRHIISFYKMQLLVMSVTLASWDVSAQVHKERKKQHLIFPIRPFYDDITSPGNSHSAICACLCVSFCLGLPYPSLSTVAKIKSNQTEILIAMMLCVFNDRDPSFCVVTHEVQETSCSFVIVVFVSSRKSLTSWEISVLIHFLVKR